MSDPKIGQTMIGPGGRIGILGGGQLGRMLAVAAARLGYRCHVYAPEEDSIAAEVCAAHTRAPWTDSAALAAFAADLPHGFNQQIKPVHAGMAVRKPTAIGIHRKRAAGRDAAMFHKAAAFALFAKAKIFQE